jgi:hypothetical protein
VIVSACRQQLRARGPTFGAFLEPGFEPPGKGAGAAFFPFGACIPVLPSVPVAVIERRVLRAISSSKCPSSSLKRLRYALLHTAAQAIINIRTRLELRVSEGRLHCKVTSYSADWVGGWNCGRRAGRGGDFRERGRLEHSEAFDTGSSCLPFCRWWWWWSAR